MLGLDLIDWLVIVGYLVGITLLGVWAMKKVRSMTSFFMGDRKFGKIMMMFFTFGAGTHSDQAVQVAAKTYRVGASGIWYQWLWLFVTPFFWLLAPLFRRMRAVTTADFFYYRYNQSVSVLYAFMGVLQLMVGIGMMLKGSSAMVTAVSGGNIPPTMAMWAMTVMFVIYGVAGGLSAAIVTNFVQGILTIVLSFMILPFALAEVGGLSGLRETISDPGMFKIVAPGEITAFYIAVIAFNALIGWVAQPQSMSMSAAGKTEMEGRVGVMCGIIIKRICTIAWVLTGLCAVGMYLGRDVHVDQVYGLMANDLLPKIAPGLVGLFIASMLAAVMSSCDTCMVAAGALFTENIYKPMIVKGRQDRHYMIAGRIISVVVVLSGILFAYLCEDIVQALEIFWKVSAMMGIAFFAGLFWRRATSAAAWASTLISFAALLFTSTIKMFDFVLWDFNARFAGKLPDFMLYNGELALHWQMIIYLSLGFIATIVFSLFTKPEDDKKLDKLYECIRTPIGPDEPETIPFTLPEGVEPAPRRLWINIPGFEIPKPALVTVVGFFAGWVAVGILIWSFFLILGQ